LSLIQPFHSEFKALEMSLLNIARIEEEMRLLAEERIQSVAGDAPMLTLTQLGRVWGKSPTWVARMRTAGRVPTVPFGRWRGVQRAVAITGLVKGV
jgi:hypothetical protein